MTYGTDPADADSDDDGLDDYAEAVTHGTNPLSSDTDGDGMPDGWEVFRSLDPLVADAGADPDGDGRTNLQEYGAGTDPQAADTDGDGMPDGWEADHGLDPLLDDAGSDADGDGLANLQEMGAGTDPQDADTDGDGMGDGWEAGHGLDPLLDDAAGDADGDGLANLQEQGEGTDPQDGDTDGDGLNDYAEAVTHGTDPLREDTDGDGLPDGWELDNGFEPLSDGGLAHGLAAWWAFDEGTGSAASNRVSTNWPVVLRGMAATNWVAGRAGGGLWFGGANYAAASQAVAVVTGAPFTVAAVVWQDGAGTSLYSAVVSDGTLLSGDRWPGFVLRCDRAANRMMGYAGNTNAAIGGLSATNWSPAYAGRWVDVALAHDGTTARLYVDGREAASATNGFEAWRQPELWIGRGHVNADISFWRGAIDDVRIYRTALGTDELAEVNEWAGDADGDGLDNGDEWKAGTDPRDADTDGDGLGDDAEVATHGTDPLSDDTDGDGMSDPWELANGLDPLLDDAGGDADGDGLTNLQEQDEGTDPQDADPDGDELNDYAETVTYGTDPADADSDDDGLDDYAEAVTHGTNPLSSDTDGDGMPDAWEVSRSLDPLVADAGGDPDGDGRTNLQEMGNGTDPLDSDSDNDGLDDGEEYSRGTDPLSLDTDSDGLPDGWEVDYGFDPMSDGGTNHALVARWTFDEGSGTTVSNRISTNWPGTLRNMAATNWIAGRAGGALWFGGANYAAVSQAVAVVTGAPFTVAAVVWQDGAGTSLYSAVVSDGTLLSGRRWPGFVLRHEKTPNALMGYAGNTNAAIGGVAATNWSPACTGRWVDVALSHDGTTTRLFVGGREVASASNAFEAHGQPELWIGRGHVNADIAFWRGKIDDVRIFRAALDTNALVEVNDWIGDPDADGFNNGREWEMDTDPLAADLDIDGDGMPDAWETANGLNPSLDDSGGDPDGDGLVNLDELGHATDPQDADSDDDGLNDCAEVATHGTDPLDADSDDDGLGDYAETETHGTDPLSADSDGDGLSDPWEVGVGLDPLLGTGADGASGDPDGDGLSNLQEMGHGTNPLDADTDADGLNDYAEAVTHGTDPLLADTDSDGLPDGWEVVNGFSPSSDGGTNRALVARWTFDEGSGATASNRVSTNWPGTLRNMASSNWIAGRAGGALGFDGTDDYVSVDQTNSGAVVTGAPFTVSATIWQDAAGTADYPTVVSDGTLLSGNRWPGFLLRYARDWNQLVGYAGNTNVEIGGIGATNWSSTHAGRWVDVALSHDGTTARLFVDGREMASAVQAFDAYRQPELRMGWGHVNADVACWQGAIDDVRIFRSALDADALAEVNDWIGDADADGLRNGNEYGLGTDPRDADTDGDGLTDDAETETHGTDPLSNDSDSDGMPDAWEVTNGLDPLANDAGIDADGDGLTNLQELGYGTNPQNADPDGDGLNDYAETVTYGTDAADADSDGDGLDDYAEAVTHGTNPLAADTDGDGMPDAWEVAHGTNPLADDAAADPDGDGRTNLQEYGLGTHPNLPDTDGDGMPDGWEAEHGMDPLLDDAAGDADGDGWTNLQEYNDGTDPQSADTDADGMPDGWEADHGLNPLVNDAAGDPDGDGLTNLQEYPHGTDPQDADTDDDGLTDYAETIAHGTNPLSADTDADGLPDGWEGQHSFDPRSDGGSAYGLTAWWAFDDGAGSTASNRVSANWPGVLRNMSASNWMAGRAGGALAFDGASGYVAVSQALAVVTAAPFTVAAVIWQDEAGTLEYPTVVSDGQYLSGVRWPGFVLRYDRLGNRLIGYAGNTNATIGGVAATNWSPGNAGRWVDVALSHDGTWVRMFVDGREVAAATNAFEAYVQPELWIGRGHANADISFWKGAIDDLRVFRAALGTNELAGVNEWAGDADGDGLDNGDEWGLGTDPRDGDSDADGLGDFAETGTYGTDPLDPDTDADGMPDAWEVANGLDPLVDDAAGDADVDGLTNLQEFGHGTDPQNADPDGDGIEDDEEIAAGTDPYDADSDDDGLDDGAEAALGTNPLAADTDTDGLPDAWEVANGTNPLLADAAADPDLDGLTNLQEQALGTDPQQADTDYDGLDDDEELALGTDPLDADTDADGLPDGWEADHSFDPLSDGGRSLGLVAWWAFDDGAGAMASNRVSTNWPGTLRGMAESNWVTGRAGWALEFDGANGYVAVSQALAVVTAAPFTVAAVLWQDAAGTSEYPTVVSDGQFLTGVRWPGFVLRYERGDDRMVGFAGNTNASIGGVAAADWKATRLGRWVDVALAHDGTNARLFVEGRLAAVATNAFDAVRQAELWIGRGHVNADISLWQGAIDDLRIFRAALGTNELAAANEWAGDADGDGLDNGDEWGLGTDPRDADSDGDGLNDDAESAVHGTDPLDPDTDGDGMRDDWEITHGTDALADDAGANPDGDGLTNLQEYLEGTNPQDADPDGDGFADDAEIAAGTDPYDADSDDDGLNDGAEAALGTNPLAGDTDGDGLPDAWEVAMGLNPLSGAGADGAAGDPDGDELTNLQEYGLGTHPQLADTDADGLDDDEELALGTDPLDADSDADGLPDGWEVDFEFNPLSGMGTNLDLRCWLQFDEGGGTSLVNSAATDYYGEIRSAADSRWTNGVSGGALWLSGTNAHVAIPQAQGAVVTGAPFTVCAWVWQEPDSTALYPTIFSDSRWLGGANWPGFLLRVYRAADALIGMVGHPEQSTTEATVHWWNERWRGRWTHVALVQNASNTQIYVDGSLWAENDNPFAPATNAEIRVGRGHVNDMTSWWRGKVDDFRIYGTALTPAQLQELYDAQGDANGDGTNNLAAFEAALDPRTNAAAPSAEGALDLRFVPENWTPDAAPQYLARFDDSNPGGEIHLFVENDALNFLLIDADGGRHRIQHTNLVAGGFLMADATNRVTASWRGFNSGRSNAEMRLFINGLDYREAGNEVNNPRLTLFDWETRGSYWNAAFVQADWNAAVRSNQVRFGSWADGTFTARVRMVETHVHPQAYGMVATNPTPTFALEPKTPPAAGTRPQVLIQDLPHPPGIGEMFASNDVRILVRRVKQVADAAEYDLNWMGWGSPETVWDIWEHDVRTAIAVGHEEGFGVALSSWSFLDAKICRKYPAAIPNRAECFTVVTNGTEARVVLTNAIWTRDGVEVEPKLDFADRATVGSYLDKWQEDLSQYSGYDYFFFNEDALQPMWDSSYLQSPTCSTNGLAWFREYVAAKYGSAYADIRFPVHPLALGVLGGSNETAFTVALDDAVAERAEFTTDPDHWAKWWEWRQVVFAHLMDGYARRLAELNAANTNWRGAIHFVAPMTAWMAKSGQNLELLSKIPHLNWLVVANIRRGTYGTSPERMEDEARLQLRAAKAATSTNTGFGSYAMVHAYANPIVSNNVTNATYNVAWITQDVAFAVAPEFRSGVVVPFSSAMMVNRPGYTSDYQNVHYEPGAADVWSRARFGRMWSPLEGHAAAGDTATNVSIRFSWAPLEQAVAYDWEFSSSSNFVPTNGNARTTATNHSWSMVTNAMPAGQPLYWRVRGIFPVASYDDVGRVTGRQFYDGAWARAPNPVVLADADADGLPDAWENHYFHDGDETAAGDSDGDGLVHSQEYAYGANPLLADTDVDGLNDFAEALIYGTRPLDPDSDGDGLNDRAEAVTYGTDPLDPDSDGDGLGDYEEIVIHGTDPWEADTDGDGLSDKWEVDMGLDPLADDSENDADADGLANVLEFETGTDPLDPDTDGDGLNDGMEVVQYLTDPLAADTDGDGLGDHAEIAIFGTQPLDPDTDGDGMLDGWEVRYALDPLANDAAGDPDGDGLTNLQEHGHGSHPRNVESDSDGLPDRWEVDHGFDPASDGGLAHGLVAHWNFDEGAGNIASNRVSTNWPGVLRYMVESNWSAGRGGGALWLDGINDSVVVAQTNAGPVVTSAPFTVTATFWQDAAGTSEYSAVVSDGTLLSGNRWPGFLLRYVRNGNALMGYAGGTNEAIGGLAATNWSPEHVGRWIDVALSHDGTRARLFVDGRQVSAATNLFSPARQPALWIGRGHVNADISIWRGLIDDVRIFRAALDVNALSAVNDWIGDPDADGLNNGREWELGTDPRDEDSDADGLDDHAEVEIHGTDPLDGDTDGDGMADAWEVVNGLNALLDDAAGDEDSDGLTNLQEQGYGTNPQAADPDGDGLNDYQEVVTFGTDPADPDSDDDGLNDYAEAMIHGTNPLNPDSDGDGLPDPWELAVGLDPLIGTGADGGAGDPDGDGRTNLQEMSAGTDPLDIDSDSDGLDDGEEFAEGTDPLDADTDSDGLQDGWEVDYAFNPRSDGGTNQALVARWTFDEGVGAVASNRISTHWPALLRNMAASNWIAGRAGFALGFDGLDDYVAVSQAAAVVTSAPFTMTAVIWQDASGTGDYPAVVSDGSLLSGDRWPGFVLRYSRSGNHLIGYAGSTNAPAIALVATNWSPAHVGRWVDVALSHDRTNARLFVDGKWVASAANAFTAYRQSELWIGRGHVNADISHWRGAIDDVRIFRSALGTNELAEVNDWIGDADGDGWSNGQEFEGASDPRNPDSP
ncbi:MAG: LamG-like jellyroll fold domain-containing protein [Kiritimatiellia bacterium]